MNCKPDELACVVRLPEDGVPEIRSALQEQLIGRIVRVIALVPGTVDTWTIAEPFTIKLPIGSIAVAFQMAGLEDHLLQPIRGVPVFEEKRDEVPA